MRAVCDEEWDKKLDKLENFLKLLADTKIIVFGCGRRGRALLKLQDMFNLDFVAYTDNNEKLWGTNFDKYPVIAPSEINKDFPAAKIIIANKLNGEKIKAQLIRLGVEENRIMLLKVLPEVNHLIVAAVLKRANQGEL